MIGKLIGVLSIGSSLANIRFLQRFLEGIVGVIALTILSAAMAALLLLGGFYGVYVGLTHYGLDPTVALLSLVGIGVLLTIGLTWLALEKMRQLHELSHHILPRDLPQFPHITSVINAFLEGLKTNPPSSLRR